MENLTEIVQSIELLFQFGPQLSVVINVLLSTTKHLTTIKKFLTFGKVSSF